MIIISKKDAVAQKRIDTQFRLNSALEIPRGTRKAREEAMLRRLHTRDTCLCPGCGNAVYKNGGVDGWCQECKHTVDRMMSFKARLQAFKPIRSAAAYRFLVDYTSIHSTPYALHGELDPAYITDLIRAYADALKQEEDYTHQRHMDTLGGE